jgi:hypothetical protein
MSPKPPRQHLFQRKRLKKTLQPIAHFSGLPKIAQSIELLFAVNF